MRKYGIVVSTSQLHWRMNEYKDAIKRYHKLLRDEGMQEFWIWDEKDNIYIPETFRGVKYKNIFTAEYGISIFVCLLDMLDLKYHYTKYIEHKFDMLTHVSN